MPRFGPASAVVVIALVAMCTSMAVGAGRASAAPPGAWSSVSTGCPSAVGTPCYVWKSPEGVVIESVQPISETEFENLTTEAVATIDEVAGRPTTGIGSAQVEAGRTAASALETETDPAVLSGAEDAIAAEGSLSFFTGTIPLATGAVAVGWEIGSAIDALVGIEGFGSIFGGSSESGTTRFVARVVTPVKKGEVIASNGYAESPRRFFEAPHDGFKVGFCAYPATSCGTPYYQVWAAGTHHPGSSTVITEGIPAGAVYGQVLSAEIESGPEKGSLSNIGGYFLPLKVEAIKSQVGTSLAKNFPGLPDYTSSSWPSHTLAEQQANMASSVLEDPEDKAFDEWLPKNDGVAGHANTFVATRIVPDCSGLLYAKCAERIEEAGLHPTHEELGWQKAVTADPPLEVEELAPARSTEVETGSTVTVTTNPDESGMPVVVPAPGADETYAEYAARLNPALVPHEHVLGEFATDPAYGPNAVTATSPVPGTRVDPAVSTSLDVQVNPATAPDVSTSAGGWSPPSIDPISLAPLSGLHVGCSTFPFGIFCWLKDGLTSWGPGGACPDLSLPFVSFSNSAGHFDGAKLESSTCGFEPAMEIIRPMLVVLACISLAAMFAYAALGIGGGGAGTDG